MRSVCVVVVWLCASVTCSQISHYDDLLEEFDAGTQSDVSGRVLLDFWSQEDRGYSDPDSKESRILVVNKDVESSNSPYWPTRQSDGFVEDTFSAAEGPNDIPSTDTDMVYEKLTREVDSIVSAMKEQKDKIMELEMSNKKLQDKIDIIEQQAKSNNLIFLNVRESKRESFSMTLQKVLYIINRVMKVRMNADDISVALRSDDSEPSQSPRPIIVRFTTFASKMKVMAARGKLSRSDIEVIYDFTEEVAKTRNQLLPYLQAARLQGHHAFLLYDRLVVDGVKMTLQELQAEEKNGQQNTRLPKYPSVTENPLEMEDPEGCMEPQMPDDQVEEVEVDPQFQEPLGDYE